jgi:hypothetical protein
VCCPEPEQHDERVAALVHEYEHDGGADKHPSTLISADWLLSQYDIVPQGVGEAIAKGYKQFFKEKLR